MVLLQALSCYKSLLGDKQGLLFVFAFVLFSIEAKETRVNLGQWKTVLLSAWLKKLDFAWGSPLFSVLNSVLV